jgi:hypothetical protein
VFNNFEGGTGGIGDVDAGAAGFLARLRVVIGVILTPTYQREPLATMLKKECARRWIGGGRARYHGCFSSGLG